MASYDVINGTFCETKEIYDVCGGTLNSVAEGYDNVNGSLNQYFSKGEPGTEENPFKVSNLTDWADYAEKISTNQTYVDSNGDTQYYLDASYKLTSDLDFSSYSSDDFFTWGTVMYTANSEYYSYGFRGVFDGNNHTIVNMVSAKCVSEVVNPNTTATISTKYDKCRHPFGKVCGTVKNLIFDGSGDGSESKSKLCYSLNGGELNNIKIKNVVFTDTLDKETSTYSEKFGFIGETLYYGTISDCLIDSTNKFESIVYNNAKAVQAVGLFETIYKISLNNKIIVKNCSYCPDITIYNGLKVTYRSGSSSSTIGSTYISVSMIGVLTASTSASVIIENCKHFPKLVLDVDNTYEFDTSSSVSKSSASDLFVRIGYWGSDDDTTYSFNSSTLNNNLSIEDKYTIDVEKYVTFSKNTSYTGAYGNFYLFYNLNSGVYYINAATGISADGSTKLSGYWSYKFDISKVYLRTTTGDNIISYSNAKLQSFVNTLNSNTTGDPWKYSSGNYPTLPCER